ncbi:MAG: VWA domain-containing protein [Flavobacteriales bacterium]
MGHVIRIVFLLLSSVEIFAQLELTPSHLHYSATNPDTEWVVDIRIKNKANKRDFILRTDYSASFEVVYTSKQIDPDSSTVMRVKFNPEKYGPFKENITVYFASAEDPIVIPVRAEVNVLNPDGKIACPDFNRRPADCCPSNMFLVEVVDHGTGLPLSKSLVTIQENGVDRMILRTSHAGRVTQSIPISYYHIMAQHPGYYSASTDSYINHRKAYFKFELVRDSTKVIEEVLVDTLTVTDRSDTLLLDERYRMNNLVFLLDVSSSMAKGQKLKYMQAAMSELVHVLREGDQMAMVSYADHARVLLSSKSGSDKGGIQEIIDSLHAAGGTSGTKGFKRAFSELKNHKIEDGNNQLIVITDGMFDQRDIKGIQACIRKYHRKGVVTSIVGIQCPTYAKTQLKQFSELGGGDFIALDSELDLQGVVKEIKMRSAK